MKARYHLTNRKVSRVAVNHLIVWK